MNLHIEPHTRLELLAAHHAQHLFDLIDHNRNYLREWLTFVDYMSSLTSIKQFVKGSMQRNEAGNEYAFVIISADMVIGRIGVYKIDGQNKIGEIGYWLAEKAQGKGTITQCCQTLIEFCFKEIRLNRLEIKCATQNLRSIAIAGGLRFTKEGIVRQGEWLNDQFVDLNLYSQLASEYNYQVA